MNNSTNITNITNYQISCTMKTGEILFFNPGSQDALVILNMMLPLIRMKQQGMIMDYDVEEIPI